MYTVAALHPTALSPKTNKAHKPYEPYDPYKPYEAYKTYKPYGPLWTPKLFTDLQDAEDRDRDARASPEAQRWCWGAGLARPVPGKDSTCGFRLWGFKGMLGVYRDHGVGGFRPYGLQGLGGT